MKGLLLGLLFATSHPSPEITAVVQSSDWKLNGELTGQCALATLGNVRDERGAQLVISCDSDDALTGSITMQLPATALQYKRITITADIEHGVGFSSTVWMKSLHDSQTILFDSDVEQTLLNVSDSGLQRSLATVVARDATSVSVGLMLHGKGVITLRNVRVNISNEGDVAPQAQQVLDSALQLIRQHSYRNNVDWIVLASQAQQFAAGSQTTSDVYPVIRYVLQQLGDQRGMLLTPEVSRMFSRPHAQTKSIQVQFFSLPDGAELVLGTDAVVDRRIADR
jgi:hypothetical protein